MISFFALLRLIDEETMYECNFEGRRYDVGDEQGFLEATIEYALRRDDLKEELRLYLKKLNI